MAVNVCPQCKTPNRVSARFCSECGEPLISGQSTTPPSAATPPEDEDTISGPTSATQAGYQAEVVLQGRYRLENELGRGGFGAVYKAWDTNISRPCAVKENLDPSTEAARQFAREASVLANLSHPNLPRVTDHFSIPGTGQYLVMDFVDGEDLATILERQKIVPLQQAVEWVAEVAGALEYLHEQEPPVLHRDIKPANIRITRKNKAMLVDFGLVKLYSPGLQTTMGARAVTPGYAPPEQYGKGKTDARTDIYALGATLYHITTGVEPLESVQRVSGERMQPAHLLNPGIPLSLSQVIDRSLALDPTQRFQNANEFRRALIANHEAPTELWPPIGLVQPEPAGSSASVSPAMASQPASQPLPSKPAAGSHAAPAGAGPRPASQPAVRRPSQPSVRPASQPRPATQKRWLPATTIVAAIVLCLVAALVVSALVLTSGPSAADITATVQAQQTQSAGIQATSTRFYEIRATQTAAAQPAP